jgi:hypothetical protein
MLKTVLRRKRRRWSSRKSSGSGVGGSSKTTARNTTMTITTMTTTTTTSTTKSLSRSQTTGYNKWRITNQGTTSKNTNIHTSVGPAKGVKKSEAPHINKDSSSLYVLMMFFIEIFIC